MTNTPDWRKQMLDLQAERDAKNAPLEKKAHENAVIRENERQVAMWNRAKEKFAVIDFRGYPETRPAQLQWELDGYIFDVDAFYLSICKHVPPAANEHLIPEGWTRDGLKKYGYAPVITRTHVWNSLTLLDIADMLSDIDSYIKFQTTENEAAITRVIEYEARWNQDNEAELDDYAPVESLADRLTALIREIVADVLADREGY